MIYIILGCEALKSVLSGQSINDGRSNRHIGCMMDIAQHVEN